MEYIYIASWTFMLIGIYYLWSVDRRGKLKHESSEDIVGSGLAEDIIDSYIEPAMFGISPADRLSIRKDLLARFSQKSGAKIGEHRFNGNMLHHWMKYNAARLIVEHRNDMQ